tara:strand:+ start:84 stop:599 length:516 start_codon:yes stop_codon:yes gene_type:complete
MLELLIATSWILFGIVYCNGLEWVIHKHLLHRKKSGRWGFHWKHHGLTKKNKGEDPEYSDHWFSPMELVGITTLAVLHFPLVFVLPWVYLAVLVHGATYLYIHRKTHVDIGWAKKHVPWHWDHHMGPKKAVEANWCVTFPLFDYVMRTRVKYYNTDEYYLDLAKRSLREIK